MPSEWLSIRIDVPEEHRDAVVDWLVSRGATGVEESYPGVGEIGVDGPVVSGDPAEWAGDAPDNPTGCATLRAWFDADESVGLIDEMRATFGTIGQGIEAGHEPDQDWNAAWRASWKPTPAGRHLLICPSWIAPTADEDRLIIRIDPGMAFGSGTHFTTAGCLAILEDVMRQTPVPERLLDVGCGSGILAIAGLRMGVRYAMGIDVDPCAVVASRENAILNGVAERFEATDVPLSEALGTWPLVLANILAPTILRLADGLVRAVQPDGALILSGILVTQERRIHAAMRRRGMQRFACLRDTDWVALGYRRLGPSR